MRTKVTAVIVGMFLSAPPRDIAKTNFHPWDHSAASIDFAGTVGSCATRRRHRLGRYSDRHGAKYHWFGRRNGYRLFESDGSWREPYGPRSFR
jgi:hypothetical protein